jgi:hypothetical protein
MIVELHVSGTETSKGRENLEDLGIDGKTILKLILQKMYVVLDWIHLALDRDRWRTLVNRVMKLLFK